MPPLDYSRFIPYNIGNIIKCSKGEKISMAINKLYDRNINYIIMKTKNKKIVIIKDGIVSYKIFIEKLECQCYSRNNPHNTVDNMYCNHILYLLSKIYHLSDLIITFIDIKPIKEQFIKYILINNNTTTENVDELNNILEEEITKYFAEEICGICLLSLDHKNFNYDIFTCCQCNNYVHSKCMESWMNSKTISNMEKGCIYCKNKLT